MAMSVTVPSFLSAIATVVKAVMNPTQPTKVKTVHTKRRYWKAGDADKFKSLFIRKSPDILSNHLNGWIIYRDSSRVVEAEERWRFYRIHRIRMDAFMGVADDDTDADQAAFERQIEAVADALRLNTSVFGTLIEHVTPDVEVVESSTPIAVGEITSWHSALELEVEALEVKTL